MANLGWQDVVALTVVLAAAAYLARLGWRGVAGERKTVCATACARCSSQPLGNSAGPEQVVSIGVLGSRIDR
jgi:hypothetical protein